MSIRRLYASWAEYYDALHTRKAYEAEADRVEKIIREANPNAATLLDVACGTGRHLQLFQRHFAAQGLDANPAFLEIARRRCGDVPLHQGDMAAFDLPDRFDAVTCLFSSIGFVRTKERLYQAVATMASHLAGGGVLVIEPWFTDQTFWSHTVTMNTLDEPALKIAWIYTSDRENEEAVLRNHFLIGTPDGIQHREDVHILGLFSRVDYESAITAAGLTLLPVDESGWSRGLLAGQKRT